MAVDRLEIRLGYEGFGFDPHPRLSVLTGFWRHGIDLVAGQLLEAVAGTLGGSARHARTLIDPLLVFDAADIAAHGHLDDGDRPGSLEEAFTPSSALQDRARQLIVPFPRGTTLILRDPFAHLGTFDLVAALATLDDVGRRHQLLLLTEDPRQLGWAEIRAAEAEAALVSLDGLPDPRPSTTGAPPVLCAAL